MEPILIYQDKQTTYLKNILTNSICSVKTFDYKNFLREASLSDLISKINQVNPFIHANHTNSTLSIYIVTTMACNLTCSYCFENDKSREPSLSFQYHTDDIVRMLLQLLHQQAYENIEVCFTGGEPLINFKFIKQLVSIFDQKINLPISYSLITNGTIMSKAILLFLEEHKFHLQISFDGSKSFHNLERKNSIGVGTYDRLLKNVAHLLNESKQISIQIRVNITKNNWKSIGELFSDLVPFSKYDQFVVYFDFVAVPLSSPLYISNSNKLEISLYLINELERYHLPWLKEIVNGGYCMYKNNNAFTIHANGDLYKCYSLVGDDHYIHGSIFKKDINIQGSGSLCEECDCPYYELCYGGCPFDYFAIHNKMEKNCQYHFLDSLSKLVFLAEIGKLTGHDDNLLIQHVKMKPVEL